MRNVFHTLVKQKKRSIKPFFFLYILFNGDSAGVRTQDPILKRDVLYQLSY